MLFELFFPFSVFFFFKSWIIKYDWNYFLVIKYNFLLFPFIFLIFSFFSFLLIFQFISLYFYPILFQNSFIFYWFDCDGLLIVFCELNFFFFSFLFFFRLLFLLLFWFFWLKLVKLLVMVMMMVMMMMMMERKRMILWFLFVLILMRNLMESVELECDELMWFVFFYLFVLVSCWNERISMKWTWFDRKCNFCKNDFLWRSSGG